MANEFSLFWKLSQQLLQTLTSHPALKGGAPIPLEEHKINYEIVRNKNIFDYNCSFLVEDMNNDFCQVLYLIQRFNESFNRFKSELIWSFSVVHPSLRCQNTNSNGNQRRWTINKSSLFSIFLNWKSKIQNRKFKNK